MPEVYFKSNKTVSIQTTTKHSELTGTEANQINVKVNRLHSFLYRNKRNVGALHTGTETGFTESGSGIRNQCGVAWVPHGMQTTHQGLIEDFYFPCYAHCTAWLKLTHCYTRCHAAQHAAWIRIEAAWRQSGLWIRIPDPHRIRIQSSVWRAPKSLYYITIFMITKLIACTKYFDNKSLTCFAPLLILKFHRQLRRTLPRKILIQFCISKLCLYLIFLAGIDSQSRVGCMIVTGLLHYFVLATILWMAVEARHMYISLVTVFEMAGSRFMLKAVCFAWGKLGFWS